MRVRRCHILLFEPRETFEFDLDLLLAGESGLRASLGWVALAPHLGGEVAVTADEVLALGAIGSEAWVELGALEARHAPDVLRALVDKGLLVGDHAAHAALRAREEALRDTHWKPLAAAAHYASRWQGVDAGADAAQDGIRTMSELVERLGAPPPHVVARVPPQRRVPLARERDTALDELLRRRVTCRNFDTGGALDARAFARILHRVYGAQDVVEIQPDNVVLKKTSPSGGGLHPTDVYLIVQRVEGVAPGVYHYHAVDHALEPMRALDADAAAALATRAVAGQRYFAQAPVLVVLTSRFKRSYWKYRNHDKAYRALVLDVGHLSQTLYVSATEFGLGAFVTAAINEVDIERELGLDPLVESPLAVCGFGARAAQKHTAEFDPLAAVWPHG
jgi:putative peptide maturation dehydrogenase